MFAHPESQHAARPFSGSFVDQAALAEHALQASLCGLNRDRLAPAAPRADWQIELRRMAELSQQEGLFLERERAAVSLEAREAPSDAAGFCAWFDALREHGPGQFDPLFDFLAEHATHEQVRWFVRQEIAGEAGFDDLVALTQLRLPEQAKLELARNYWDEMGRGKALGMHGPMLTRLATALQLDQAGTGPVVWESLALGNVLAGLAYNRRYAFHSLGALGAVELTAPTRAVKVVEALDRLGYEREASHYFRLHASIDVVHARAWRDEVLAPLVRAQPQLSRWLAEGALMRLRAGARCFARYRQELSVSPTLAGKRS